MSNVVAFPKWPQQQQIPANEIPYLVRGSLLMLELCMIQAKKIIEDFPPGEGRADLETRMTCLQSLVELARISSERVLSASPANRNSPF